MDRREELKRQAREEKTEAAVYQIRSVSTGKVLVESVPNTRMLNRRKAELARGVHHNAELRAALAAQGAADFVVEILEILDEGEDLAYRVDALKQLEAQWIEKLRPWGDRGYNPPSAEPGKRRGEAEER